MRYADKSIITPTCNNNHKAISAGDRILRSQLTSAVHFIAWQFIAWTHSKMRLSSFFTYMYNIYQWELIISLDLKTNTPWATYNLYLFEENNVHVKSIL